MLHQKKLNAELAQSSTNEELSESSRHDMTVTELQKIKIEEMTADEIRVIYVVY